MAFFGLVPEGGPAVPECTPFYLWPCNVQAWELFLDCQSQWRLSVAGREGLDYTGVEIVMARKRIRRRLRDQCFAAVQAMEQAALSAWAEK